MGGWGWHGRISVSGIWCDLGCLALLVYFNTLMFLLDIVYIGVTNIFSRAVSAFLDPLLSPSVLINYTSPDRYSLPHQRAPVIKAILPNESLFTQFHLSKHTQHLVVHDPALEVHVMTQYIGALNRQSRRGKCEFKWYPQNHANRGVDSEILQYLELLYWEIPRAF